MKITPGLMQFALRDVRSFGIIDDKSTNHILAVSVPQSPRSNRKPSRLINHHMRLLSTMEQFQCQKKIHKSTHTEQTFDESIISEMRAPTSNSLLSQTPNNQEKQEMTEPMCSKRCTCYQRGRNDVQRRWRQRRRAAAGASTAVDQKQQQQPKQQQQDPKEQHQRQRCSTHERGDKSAATPSKTEPRRETNQPQMSPDTARSKKKDVSNRSRSKSTPRQTNKEKTKSKVSRFLCYLCLSLQMNVC